jgi:hypothetical protein
VRQDLGDRRGSGYLEVLRLPKKHQTQRMVQLGVGQDHALDGGVADTRGDLPRETGELGMDVG